MADAETRPPTPEGRSRHAARWWLAAATFVVGAVVGAILVGLVSEDAVTVPGDTAIAQPTSAQRSGTTSAQPSSTAAGGTAAVVVNDACLRALNAAQDIYAAVNDLGEAASQLNAARLDEAIRRLQPLQTRLRANISDCEVVTQLPDGSATTSTPSLPTGAAPTS